MSNFIIRQKGPSSVVADNIWELRLGLGSLLLGLVAGGLGGVHLPEPTSYGATSSIKRLTQRIIGQ